MIYENEIIQSKIDEYNETLKTKASKLKEIEQLKSQIDDLELECSNLDIRTKEIENVMQAEVYDIYSSKDLLKIVGKVEKHAKREVIADFKSLLEKFKQHDLGVNDITQLQTYIKIYGKYVADENSIIKGFFKAFGGKTDG